MVKKLTKQPEDFGTLYSYTSPNLERRGRLFVFNDGNGFVEREFGGLEGAIRFEEEHFPGDFEFNIVGNTAKGFRALLPISEDTKIQEVKMCVFVKGHPYQSLVTLHRIEQAIPQSDKYELIPLRKYFGTDGTIVTELILDPAFEFDGVYLLSEGSLERARESGEEKWFENHLQNCSWSEPYRMNLPLSERLSGLKPEEILPFAEEALEALYVDLEATGRRLRISRHVDPRLSNVFLRGINEGKFQFTLTDQYHCGSEELRHHQIKYGGAGILRMG